MAQAASLPVRNPSPGVRPQETDDLRVYAAQRLVLLTLSCATAVVQGRHAVIVACVEPGHELAIGGAGGG